MYKKITDFSQLTPLTQGDKLYRFLNPDETFVKDDYVYSDHSFKPEIDYVFQNNTNLGHITKQPFSPFVAIGIPTIVVDPRSTLDYGEFVDDGFWYVENNNLNKQ